MDEDDLDFAIGGDRSALEGASLFDSAAESIRNARLGPMAAPAGAAYAQQAGGLQSLLGRMGERRDASLAALREAYKDSMPSDSEKWLGVAAALLSPTESGKTSESIGRALGVFGQYAGEKRKARAEQALGVAGLASKYDLAEGTLAARMLGQKPPRLAFDALGRARDPYSGAVIEPQEDIPVLTPEQVVANPGIQRWQTTDGRIMER